MATNKHLEDDLSLEVTVISAHSLKNSTCFLIPCSRLRPYVTLSPASTHQKVNRHNYRTQIDENGAHSPKWGETITVPITPDFLNPHIRPRGLEDGQSNAVRVRVMSKRLFGDSAELGWCNIRADDVVDGLKPPSKRRRLSYALRSPRHGCSGYGIVELAVRVVGHDVDRRAERMRPAEQQPEPGWRRVAIGIPVGLSPEGLVAAAAAAAPEPAWGCDGARVDFRRRGL